MALDPLIIPITALVCVAVTSIGLPIARAYGRRMDREPTPREISPDVTARLERMEQALDSIAIEIERISEGQRFTTKLLAERGAGGQAGVPDRQPGNVPASTER
jgi:hypothetical protein